MIPIRRTKHSKLNISIRLLAIIGIVSIVGRFAYDVYCSKVSWYPIHRTAFAGDFVRLGRMVKSEPQAVRKTDSGGRIALHYAAEKGSKEMVAFLVESGSDVNARDRLLGTPLYFAVQAGRKGIVDLLLNKGADPNIAGPKDGLTPLHCAAQLKGGKGIVELLIAKGANVNAPSLVGITPLHMAVGWRNKDIVEVLLAHGADVNAKDQYGMTPVQDAERDGNEELVRTLKGLKTRP
jgi:ankyrin repeat protein